MSKSFALYESLANFDSDLHLPRESCDALTNTHTHSHIHTRRIYIHNNIYFYFILP